MQFLKEAHLKLKKLLHLLNSESREALLALPGIGHKRVDSILEKRAEIGQKLRIKDVVHTLHLGPLVLTKITEEPQTATVIKYAVLYQTLVENLVDPANVLSVDLGVTNSAYALLDRNFKLVDWCKVDLGMPRPYSAQKCYDSLKTSLDNFPSAELCVLEAQSHRSLPSTTGFLGIGLELRILEAMVYTILKTVKNMPVYSVLAKQVAQYFQINSKKTYDKKKASVALVKQLLGSRSDTQTQVLRTPMDNCVTVPQHLAEYFQQQKKKDDLSDCLLQALAFMEWSEMSRDL